jgi:hypothetical protein
MDNLTGLVRTRGPGCIEGSGGLVEETQNDQRMSVGVITLCVYFNSCICLANQQQVQNVQKEQAGGEDHHGALDDIQVSSGKRNQ